MEGMGEGKALPPPPFLFLQMLEMKTLALSFTNAGNGKISLTYLTLSFRSDSNIASIEVCQYLHALNSPLPKKTPS